MRAYHFRPEAEADLNEIWEFLSEDNPAAADRVTEDIIAAIETLADFPHIGHRRPDLTSRPLRFWPMRNYVLAYAPVMAAILRSREA